jgi:hypothetical protein
MLNIYKNNPTFNKILYGGLSKELGKRTWISAFTYILLLLIYSLETAGYVNGPKAAGNLKKDGTFFALLIAFSIFIPLIMIVTIFLSRVEPKAESWMNIIIWVLMLAHMGMTLAAFIIAAPDVSESVRGFAYTRIILIFLAMGLALQNAKVHKKKKYGGETSGSTA